MTEFKRRQAGVKLKKCRDASYSLISMLWRDVRRLQLQVQETLAAVAFKTPIKFNI